MSIDLFAAFFMGIAGSGHCLAMCGGLAGAMGYQRSLANLTIYNLGRISSYTLAGALVAALSVTLQSIQIDILIYLRLLAGIMMVLLACYILDFKVALLWLERLGTHLWRRLQPLALRTRTHSNRATTFAAGVLWGWLPCGLVYSALTWSATTTTIHEGALFMFAFGVGTLPSMLGAGVLSQKLTTLLKAKAFRWTFALILALYGIQTLFIAIRQLA
ncbi:MAG: hypothetical protein HLUCCO02_02965 [Idiomarinaceae bacterium HL-53]|nr:MAG: hypothetical protein HLUCCO02_02965 [Idiomarinaceae bacterium HL-53]CUS48982.1 hypothetical protein Ga0003345_1963 [Idiomarinaceae bacterium HL-53]